MQQIEPLAEVNGAERKRVEAVVQTLASAQNKGENLAEVAHDARNMVTALGLYCDLLEEPGVLGTPFLHYGSELRLVAAASRSLVEKLAAFDIPKSSKRELSNGAPYLLGTSTERGTRTETGEDGRDWKLPACPIEDFAAELTANRNLLAALAGPLISIDLNTEDGALPVSMTGEDLTRILVNLVKNAAEAMPEEGCITVGLHEFHAGSDAAPWLVLTVEDSGPGIPLTVLESVFESGYTTHRSGAYRFGSWPGPHRGLGLSITRSILEAAGGRIHATNREQGGARFVIELPIQPHSCKDQQEQVSAAAVLDGEGRGAGQCTPNLTNHA